MNTFDSSSLNRREFLTRAGLGAGALALGLSSGTGRASIGEKNYPLGKAEHCLFIWLGGGMAQMDTFDPKPTIGDPAAKKAGSYYKSIETAVPGMQFCEHLPKLARLAEHIVPVRTVNHNVIDEHAAATNRMHTGRMVSGSVLYPSIGSIIASQKSVVEGVPPYVLMGYPSATRGPGFLGPKAGYVYLTDTAAGPAGLSRPANVTTSRQARRQSMLEELQNNYVGVRANDRIVLNYNDAIEQGFKLQGGDFMRAFSLADEPGSVRQAFGDEFGQRCLLSRRLIQRGVRFVEIGFNLNFVNGAGWDTHNAAQKNQHLLITILDNAVSTLIDDLKSHQLLDKTLIVIASEFGRPAHFDGGGGRGHHGKCFTVVLAGGGLRTGQPVGQTDDLAMNVVADPVSVPDLFATICATVGINPSKNLMDGDRPVPITDGGVPAAKLFV